MTVKIESSTIIEVIRNREGLLELAQQLTRIAYDTSSLGVALNLGLGCYGTMEQSFEIRFINEASQALLDELTEGEQDEQESDTEEITDDDYETEEDEEADASLAVSLVALFRDMGILVLDKSELDLPTDDELETGLVETDDTEYVPPAAEDISNRYSGQV